MLSPTKLEKLKCSKCSLHLSVPPIIYDKENNFICGRCKYEVPEDSLCCTATAYQTVAAEILHFPCRYVDNGCKEDNIDWKLVRDHEVSCMHQINRCPLEFLPCEWEGKANLLYEHFVREHEESVLETGSFNLDLSLNNQEVLVTPIKDNVLIINAHNNESNLYFGIFYVEKPIENSFYKLELSNAEGEDKKTVTILEPCIVRFNMIRYNIYKIPMGVNNVKKILGSRITLKFTIGYVNKNDNSEAVDENKPGNKLYEAVSNNLECFNCKEYLTPPSYSCPNGHEICAKCKSDCGICSTCKSPVKDKLTSPATHINYLCKNKTLGCEFVGNSSTIKDHSKNCPFEHITCPLSVLAKCRWEDNAKSCYDHIFANHSRFLLNENGNEVTITRDLSTTEKAVTKIMHYEGQVFKICCRRNMKMEGIMWWSFQHVGMESTEISPYKFQIEFHDQSDQGRKFITDALCYGVSDDYKLIKWLRIPYKLLTPFIKSDKSITFTYKILKN